MPATEAQRRYVQRHPERRKATLARWHEKHKVERAVYRAGHSTPEHRAFWNAKHRCTQPSCKAFKDYGGRGIEFRLDTVEQLVASIGPRPAPGYTLDRINNEGHYEIGNLRWATRKEQANNRRNPWVSRRLQKQP